jgi:heme A synthase
MLLEKDMAIIIEIKNITERGGMKNKSFAIFSWLVLAINLGVILWGAYVRATGSGAGCGSHWPLCNGVVIPRDAAAETLIEYIHRVTSGLAGVLVLGLFVWSARSFKHDHRVYRSSMTSLVLIVIESLIGAGLVKFEWVGQDASAGRAVTIVIHLVNTFILLSALALTAWWASGGQPLRFQGRRGFLLLIATGMVGTTVLGASGALTALGDTLFPVSSLAEGLSQDFSSAAHFLIRLRILHPVIAVIVGSFLLLMAGMVRVKAQDEASKKISRFLTIFVLLQLAAGAINVLLLAPVWMQLVHLLLADVIWISLVLMGASALAE